MQEGKIGKKNMEMGLCYSAFRQFQFFHQSLESGLQYLQLNTTTALHCIHADNSKASVFSVANYHPRKVGTLCSNMTWWCHGLICIWIKLLNRSRANRSRAQQQALSHFSCWLTLPHSDEASKPLCAVQRHKISSAVQLIRTIWKEQAISQNIYESGLVTSLLPNVWKWDVFPW